MARKSIVDLAYDVLEENHRPMHYRKITQEITKIKNIKGENPHHAVNAVMGADRRFIRYQRGIWGLVKWKYREANLPYTLTSYCLLNGTITLTSYLKPYFSWHRDDRTVEIVFVDSEGKEIKAMLNYRQKIITGFREWFQDRELEVNDTVLIGLIDQTRKKYFILAEKEIKYDTEKRDIGETIYQLLYNEGKPLNFIQIYSAITRKEPDYGGLFEKYIQDILKSDGRFILLDTEQWALTEWLEEEEQLYHNLYYADSSESFYNSLKRCFQFLGFEIEVAKDTPTELFIAHAQLAFKSYYLIITGLLENYDISTIRSLDWMSLKRVRDRLKADSIILFSKKFTLPELVDRASEEGVQLYELSILEYIIKEHRQIPFSLLDLRIAFNPMNHTNNNIAKLKKIRENQWKNWFLIKMIIDILRAARTEDTYMDIDLLVKKMAIIDTPFPDGNIGQSLVKKIITVLSQEPFKLIELSASGNIILIYPDHLVEEKINNIWQFIMNKQEFSKV